MTSKQSAVPFKEIKRYGGFHGNAGVVMQEIQHYSMVQVTAFPGSEKAMFAALAAELGVSVDGTSGKGGVNDDGTIRAVWMSLNSYLIIGGGMPDRALVDRLATACGEHALVTDQSAGRACFELKGDAVVELLMMESATDFAADAFGPGESRAASWAGISCLVYFADGSDPRKPIYNLFPNRSFAQSLWEELCEAGQEYAVQVIG